MRLVWIIFLSVLLASGWQAKAQSSTDIDRYYQKMANWDRMTAFIFSDIARIAEPLVSLETEFLNYLDGQNTVERMEENLERARETIESEARFARESIEILSDPPVPPAGVERTVFYTVEKLNRLVDHAESSAQESLQFYEVALSGEAVDMVAFAETRIRQGLALLLIDRMDAESSLSQIGDESIPGIAVLKLKIATLDIFAGVYEMQIALMREDGVNDYLEAHEAVLTAIAMMPDIIDEGRRLQTLTLAEVQDYCANPVGSDVSSCRDLIATLKELDLLWTSKSELHACLSDNLPVRLPINGVDRVNVDMLLYVLQDSEARYEQLMNERPMLRRSSDKYGYANQNSFFGEVEPVDVCRAMTSAEAKQAREDAVNEPAFWNGQSELTPT